MRSSTSWSHSVELTPSATALRTTLDYDDTGEQFSVVDPKGIERRSEFDDMGRQVAVIENYEDGTPETLETDMDQIIRHGYTNGLRTTYTADLPGTDQVTTYYYGTTKGTSAGESAIATTNLLDEVQYPDSAGSPDVMSYAYNAQGQEIWRKDQDGTVLEKTYDLSGRLATDVASTLGTGIDGAVRRKEFAYDGLGRMNTATQYDATTSGTVLDQRAMAFGAWGRETSFSLDVDSTVSGGSGIGAYVCSMVHAPSWAAQAPTTRSGSRRVLPYSFTLPTGYNFVYRQGGAGYHEEAARTNAVTYNNVTTLATFEFVGDARVSSVTLQAENFVMDHSGSTSGSYPGWDDFNRQKRDQWVKAPGGINVTFLDRAYELDEGGFITEIVDNIEKDGAGNRRFDTLVTLDGLNRITRLQRGELNSSVISNESMDQQRTFDLVGNVTARTLDWNADDMYGGADEYTDSLTHNAVNEITAIDSDSLTWSAAGALTDDGTEHEYVYDAWGRMVQIRNQSSAVIANYRRDALDHLIGEQIDREPNSVVNSSDWWEYFVCRPGDMGMLASFKGSDPDALVERMWLGDVTWSPTGSFNAAAVLETRDDDVDGTLDRGTVLFIDRTGSVMANFGDDAANGKQIERLHYDAGGVPYLIPWGDVNADGRADSADDDQIDAWWNFPDYNVRGDLDLDGDVDSDDYGAFVSSASGGVDAISQASNTLGSQALPFSSGIVHAHLRVSVLLQNTWMTRDSLGYVDGPSLLGYLTGNALSWVDRSGARSISVASLADALALFPESECCSGAQFRSGSYGEVFCCNGFATPCLNSDWESFDSSEGGQLAKEAVRHCARMHEWMHILQGEVGSCESIMCSPWYPHSPPNPGWSDDLQNDIAGQNKAEVDNLKAEKECLNAKMDICDRASTGEENGACVNQIGARIRTVEANQHRAENGTYHQ